MFFFLSRIDKEGIRVFRFVGLMLATAWNEVVMMLGSRRFSGLVEVYGGVQAEVKEVVKEVALG